LNKDRRIDLSVKRERAILVGVLLPGRLVDPRDPLGELEALARSAGAIVVDKVLQRRDKPDPAFYIGKGKAEELAERVKAHKADVVIFDNDLSPAQIRDLEEIVNCKILDRSELILDIFATRAKTKQARLQVELAQLEYTAPRLRGMWTHLERLAGAAGGTAAGVVGGIGTRGPGERQIEIDRRLVRKRINQLRKEIAEIDQRKIREVRARRDWFTICLVGYTNAGKSTLMNALTGAGVHVEDKLFATLDTRTRRWNLGDGFVALLSDTVGFVRDIPHHLIASFHATLEEALHADLLIHVVDASSPIAEYQIEAVEKVLADLGCQDKPIIIALNKIDAVTEPASLHLLQQLRPQAICVSAKTGIGVDRLTEAVKEQIKSRHFVLHLEASPADSELISWLAAHGKILDQTSRDGKFLVKVVLSPRRYEQLRRFRAEVVAASAQYDEQTGK